MCTFTLAWQVFEDAPVVVAANRDEFFDRPSETPARRDWEVPTIAPKDQEANGTWIGYNEHGVLVAITNRWLEEPIEADRSRGLLVRDALGHETAEAAARFVERELDERTYDGFNLVIVDDAAAILVEWSGSRRVTNLDPGVHVVVNVGADGRYAIPSHRQSIGEQQADNADALQAALRVEPGEHADEWLDRAAAALGNHDYGVCVHRGEFGTTSSSLITLGADGDSYEFADGPPCETPYEPVVVSFE